MKGWQSIPEKKMRLKKENMRVASNSTCIYLDGDQKVIYQKCISCIS